MNVPSAVWIDEEGRIVRSNEGTYTKSSVVMGNRIGNDQYVPALKDWVDKGAKSEFALKPAEAGAKIRPRTADTALAEPTFKLGVYFHEIGDDARANAYWDKAQALNPDSWNFHRQDWSFLPTMAETMKNFTGKVGKLNGKAYYEPIDIPEPGITPKQ